MPEKETARLPAGRKHDLNTEHLDYATWLRSVYSGRTPMLYELTPHGLKATTGRTPVLPLSRQLELMRRRCHIGAAFAQYVQPVWVFVRREPKGAAARAMRDYWGRGHNPDTHGLSIGAYLLRAQFRRGT